MCLNYAFLVLAANLGFSPYWEMLKMNGGISLRSFGITIAACKPDIE